MVRNVAKKLETFLNKLILNISHIPRLFKNDSIILKLLSKSAPERVYKRFVKVKVILKALKEDSMLFEKVKDI